MAVVSTLSNHFKYMLASGDIDFDADTFKIILMNTSFAFDEDTHATLALVTASQLATEFGYTQDTKALANVSVTENDTTDKAEITWDDAQWTADGGSIGPSGAAVIYDDTTSDDTVVGCIDYGQDITATDGVNFTVSNISVTLG